MIENSLDRFFTTLSISFTGMLGAVKFNLLAINLASFGEVFFLYSGGILSSLYLILKSLNEFQIWIKRNEKK